MTCIFDFHYADKSYLRYMFHKVCKGIPVESIFFIFLLSISRDSESFISFVKMSHIFGVKKETVSVPYLTEFSLRLVNEESVTLFCRKL